MNALCIEARTCALNQRATIRTSYGHDSSSEMNMNPRNIFIRHYRRVPVADLQLLMPETTPASALLCRDRCLWSSDKTDMPCL